MPLGPGIINMATEKLCTAPPNRFQPTGVVSRWTWPRSRSTLPKPNGTPPKEGALSLAKRRWLRAYISAATTPRTPSRF